MKRALLDLQEIDTALTTLARERSRLDDGSTARAKRDDLIAQLEAEKARSAKILADRTDKELQLKTAEEKLVKQQGRMMNTTSAHEIKALERDIEGLGHARSDLDEAILTLMEEGEQSAKRLSELETLVAEAKSEVTTVIKKFAVETTRIQTQTAARQAERVAIGDKLTPAEKTRYESMAKAHQGIAISKVVRGNCSVCGAAILPFTLREAKQQEFPTCEGCGRLLFVE